MKRTYFLLIILALAIGWFVLDEVATKNEGQNQQSIARTNWLVKKYGPKRYSQNDEELIIRDFFKDRKNGTFVDVGASHYRINSTTCYLEERLGWGGIAIDAICEYGQDYLLYRKKTRFFCFFVADKSDEEIDFYINQDNRRISTGDLGLALKQGKYEKVKVPTITLNDLLGRLGLSRFDFLSMDVEMAEPAALGGFDIRKYRPSLACVEAHKEVRDQILQYFSKNGYRLLEKYEGLDPLNLYFAPETDKME